MPKKYNEEKHFDLSFCLVKGLAFFDDLDFTETDNEAIRAIVTEDIPEIQFSRCVFKDLDLSHCDFRHKISFIGCQFSGKTSFAYSHFNEDASFDTSVFNGVTDFSNVVFERGLSFRKIIAKPAKGGYFYFRGDEVKTGKNYLPNDLNMSGAVFDCEVSFLGREFLGNTILRGMTFRHKFWFTDCDIGLKTAVEPKFECDGIKDIDMCYRILKDALIRRSYTIQSREIEKLEEKILAKQRKDNDLLPDTHPQQPKHQSDLLTTEEAAEYLKLKPNTLERWRSQYPSRLPFVKIGRTVKYRLEDLQAYISDNMN